MSAVSDETEKNQKIEKLISRMSNGDKNAIGELYELVKTDVYAYALSKLKSRDDAEDVLHDTFVRLYRYSGKYEARGKPMAWIFTITMNLAKRQAELRRRHISYDETIGDEQEAPESLETQTAMSDFVRCILQILDDEEREIVVLHAVSGMKHREIAALLDKPLATVLSKYSRAIKKLQSAEEVNL